MLEGVGTPQNPRTKKEEAQNATKKRTDNQETWNATGEPGALSAFAPAFEDLLAPIAAFSARPLYLVASSMDMEARAGVHYLKAETR